MLSIDCFERDHVKPKPGRVAIIGSKVYPGRIDRRALYPDAVGFDMLPGEGVDVVQDLEQPLSMEWLFAFDHIECLSVLEHSRRPWLLAANLQRMLKPGGTIFVAVPFVWRVHAYPSDYWRMTPEAFPLLFDFVDWQQLALCSWRVEVGRKLKATKLFKFPYLPRTESAGFGVRK